MDKKDFESLLNKYPDCISDGKKLKAFLKDLFPDVPKAIVNTLTIMADDGIISEMQKAGQTPLISARLQKKLEDDYGLSQKIIAECFSLIIYDNAKQTQATINAGTYEKITSFIDIQPTFALRKEVPQKLDILQPEYDPKDFKIVKGVLKKYKGSSSVVVIPDNVTSIGGSAFSGCKGLTSVTILDSVKSIGLGAFKGCSSLESITIPFVGAKAGVTSSDTDQYPFGYIFGMSSYTGSVATEQDYYGTSKTYYIPSTLKSVTVTGGNILYNAFSNCSGLTSVTIPDSVTSIGYEAFYRCTGLTSITIPNSVTSIDSRAFEDCRGLTSITIPNSVTSIGSSAFSGCSGLTSITISDSVMSIGNNAFSGCRGLTSITISDSVTSIGNCAFRYCEKLQDIYITDIAAWCNISGLDNLMDYGLSNKKLYINNELATSITIPNGVTAIPSSAFRNCTGLTSVTIGNSVTSIGSNAFYNCTWLTSVTIGNGVTSIGDYAFDNTAWYNKQPDGLVYAGKVAYKYKGTMPWYTSIVLKEGTLGIGNNAFSGCKGLTNITIPNSVTSIGPGAFSDTAWYNNQPDGLVYAGKVAYKYKGTMPWCTSIVLKEGTLGIGQYAFYGCEELTSITIPNSVTSIGDYVFYGCTGLTSITIPNSVTSIGYRAFSGCEGLTSIIIPDSVTSIGSQAFYKCIGLTSVTIPDSVTSIGAQAFYNCIGLTSVTIPDSVTSIGAYAFRDCTRLTSVTIPDSVTSIGDEAFSSWRNLTIYCEAKSKPIGWSSYWNPGHRPVVWGVKK